MATYLITGASRGIGLGLVSDLLEQYPTTKVIATARRVSEKLSELLSKYPDRLAFVVLDVSSIQSVKAAFEEVAKKFPHGIDYLVNNAAISGATPESSEENFNEVFDINVTGVMRVVQQFMPLVQKSERKCILAVSSLAGAFPTIPWVSKFIESVLPVTSLYPYRISKAALNYMFATLANDYKGLIFVPLHPGQVDTDMNIGENPISIAVCTKGLLEVMQKLTQEDSGKFYDYQGNVHQY